MSSDIERILNFWIDEIGPGGWYAPSDDLDRRIRGDLRVTKALVAVLAHGYHL